MRAVVPAVARSVAVAVAGLAVLLLLAPATASAHTGLDRSNPADGATVEGPLRRVVLVFTGTPTAVDDTLAVADADGNVVRPVDITQEGLRIVARFDPPLPAASYAASWQVRSDDTHTVSGSFAFTVAEPAPTTSVSASTSAPTAPPTSVGAASTPVQTEASAPSSEVSATASSTAPSSTTAAPTTTLAPEPVAAPVLDAAGSGWGEDLARAGRLVSYPTLLATIGILAFLRWSYSGPAGDEEWLVQVAGWLAAAASIGSLAEVVGVADLLGGAGELWSDGDGRAALARLAGMSVAAVAAVATSGRVRSTALAAGLAVAVISFGLDGHTVTEGPRLLHFLVTTAHVASGGVWLGGVLAMALLLAYRRRRGQPSEAMQMVVSFSVVATIALVVVVLAGGVMTVMIEPDVVGTGTGWVRAWWSKVVLVGFAALLGGYHHFRIRPRLVASPNDEAAGLHLRRSIVVESTLLVAVGVASAVLVTASTV